MELQCELRYRAPEDSAWAVVSAAGAAGPGRVSKQEPGSFPPLRALPCSRREPAQPSLRLPPGHWHRWPGRQHAALWLPLRHAVPLPDAVPAELGTGLLERVEPGQELHHPRERWVRSHWGGSPLPGQAAQLRWHGHTYHPSQLPGHLSAVAAPTGKLDAWWSARPAGAGRWLEVQLRWKVSTGGRWGWGGCWGIALGTEHPCGDRASPRGPNIPAHAACAQAPRPREANGRVLGYCVTLSPRKRGRDPPTVCNTTHTQCNFSAPVGTRRVYLSAYNAAGESAPTEVILLERKGEDSANFPRSETSTCPPGALYPPPPPPPPQQLHKLSNWVPLHCPTAGETPPWVCNWGAPKQGRIQAGGHRGAMQQGCSPLLSSWLVVPMQVSPWLGSGPCPGASAASGCAGRHRQPRWLPTSWSGSGCPRSPVAAVPAGRWSVTGPPPQSSSGVSRGLPGGPCPPGQLGGGSGTPPDCPRAKPCPKSPLHTLPPSPAPTPAVRHRASGLVLWAGTGQPGALGSQSPKPLAPPLVSVADSIEPFQRYNISVYPLYKDAIGVPVHTAAYSKQKGTCAPSSCPRGPGGLTLHHQAFAFQKGEPAFPPCTPNSGAVQKSSACWAGSWLISKGAVSWTEPHGGTARGRP